LYFTAFCIKIGILEENKDFPNRPEIWQKVGNYLQRVGFLGNSPLLENNKICLATKGASINDVLS